MHLAEQKKYFYMRPLQNKRKKLVFAALIDLLLEIFKVQQ